MISRSQSGTLFSQHNQGIAVSTNPQLKSHFPTNGPEFNQAMQEILYPHGISPESQAHRTLLKEALSSDNNQPTLVNAGLSADNRRFEVSFLTNALNQPFLYSDKLAKATGHRHIDSLIIPSSINNLSTVSLLYHRNAIPHFLEWLENEVKVRDEETLKTLRELSENDDDLKKFKSTFASRIKRKLVKLERQLIIEGDKDLLVGQLLTIRASLVPAIRRQEDRMEHQICDDHETEVSKLLESFKLAINVISNEEALKNRDIAREILSEVDDYCASLQEQAANTGNKEPTSPTML